MTDGQILIQVLDDTGDHRGSSYSAAAGWLGSGFPVHDAHLTTVRPGQVRGNHHHALRREVLAVLAAGAWSVHWDRGAGTAPEHRRFTGGGCVVLQIPPGLAHAVRNDGSQPLWIVGLTDGPYDPEAPDAYPRTVVEPS